MQFTKVFEGTFAQVKEAIDEFVSKGGHVDAVITDHTGEKVTEAPPTEADQPADRRVPGGLQQVHF